MKRLQWILSTMLIIAMLLACIPGASALTVEEWNAQCTVKTVKNTIVYRPDAAGNKTQVATIPAGTFVQQNAFDNASQMWNITFLTSNGATAWGLVSATSLAVTSVTITLDDGTEVEVPEELSSDLEAAAAYLNQTRTDHYYTVSTTDGTIHAGDISEKPQTDTTKMEVPEGYEAAVVEDTFGGEGSTSEGDSADEQAEVSAETDATATQTDTSVTQADTATSETDTQTAQTDVATNSSLTDSEKIDYHRVIMMGSSKTLVNINGAQQTVDTSLIDFGTEVPYDEQLATISAPKTGKCTLLSEPKKGASKLGTLKHGTIVGVIRKGKTYTRIFANGMEGVVTNASIKTLTRGETPIGNGVLTYNGQIDNSKQINIRVKASTSAKVFDHWNCGTEVTIFSKSHSFYEIEANGIRAFVNEKFLTEGSKENIPVKTTTKKKNSGGSSKKKSNGSSSPSTPPAITTTTNTTTTNTTAPTTTTNTTTPTTTTNTTTPTTTTTTENSAPGSTTSTTTPNNSPTDATRAATENTQTNTPTTSQNALPGQVTTNNPIGDKPSTSGATGTQTAPNANSGAATPTGNSTPPSNDQSTAVGKLPASEGSGNPVGGPASAVGSTSTAPDPDRGYSTDPKDGSNSKTDTPGTSSQPGSPNTSPGATGFDTP